MRLRLVMLLVVAILLKSGDEAQGGPVHRTVWVDPTRVNLADESIMAQLFALPVQRLVVTGFVGGETIFATGSPLFATMPRYKGKPDVIAAMLARAKREGKSFYLALDCLRWVPTGGTGPDLFSRHPELGERDAKRSFGRPGGAKYASPFQHKVRESLRTLIEEVAIRYPMLDGLVLDFRLPSEPLLGYSDGAREAYRDAKGIDPVDVPLGKAPEDLQEAGKWMIWRNQECTSCFRELSDAYRARCPTGKVAAVAAADYYRTPLPTRLAVPMDWLHWTSHEAANEMFLEGNWGEAAHKDGLLYCNELMGNTPKRARLSAILFPTGPDRLEAQLRPLLLQNVQGIVLRVEGPEQLAHADLTLRDTLPRLQRSPLEVDIVFLKADPRLRAGVTADLQEPKIDELLDFLRQATGLRLPRDDNVDLNKPVTGSLSMRHMRAWDLMDLLARSKAVQGRWYRVGDDYRLVGGAPPSPEVPAPPPSPPRRALRYWLAGVGLAVLAGTGAWLAWRRLRMRPR